MPRDSCSAWSPPLIAAGCPPTSSVWTWKSDSEHSLLSEDAGRQKPQPDGLLRALDLLETPADRTVYVGDRPEDVLMGKRAGTHTFAVPSAYGSEALLREAGPDLLLEDIRNIPEAISVSTRARS